MGTTSYRFHGFTDPHNLVDNIIFTGVVSGIVILWNRRAMIVKKFRFLYYNLPILFNVLNAYFFNFLAKTFGVLCIRPLKSCCRKVAIGCGGSAMKWYINHNEGVKNFIILLEQKLEDKI